MESTPSHQSHRRNLTHHCSDRKSRNTDHTVALESVGSIGTRLSTPVANACTTCYAFRIADQVFHVARNASHGWCTSSPSMGRQSGHVSSEFICCQFLCGLSLEGKREKAMVIPYVLGSARAWINVTAGWRRRSTIANGEVGSQVVLHDMAIVDLCLCCPGKPSRA